MDIFHPRYNHKDFFVATGYKSEIIKKYFAKNSEKWNVNLIDTGQKTMTGGRLKRLQKIIGNETCMLTYGDGISNININARFGICIRICVVLLCCVVCVKTEFKRR